MNKSGDGVKNGQWKIYGQKGCRIKWTIKWTKRVVKKDITKKRVRGK